MCLAFIFIQPTVGLASHHIKFHENILLNARFNAEGRRGREVQFLAFNAAFDSSSYPSACKTWFTADFHPASFTTSHLLPVTLNLCFLGSSVFSFLLSANPPNTMFTHCATLLSVCLELNTSRPPASTHSHCDATSRGERSSVISKTRPL